MRVCGCARTPLNCQVGSVFPVKYRCSAVYPKICLTHFHCQTMSSKHDYYTTVLTGNTKGKFGLKNKFGI